MRVLVLGGTRFVGRAVADAARDRGWQVTVYNRGMTGPDPDGVEVLRGDRLVPAGLAVLAGRRWDIAVDTWSGAPRAVRDAARLLASTVEHFVYVSSRSVYAPPQYPGQTEDAPLHPGDPDAGDGPYGEMKAGGELAASAAFGERALLARAGLILGPWEDVGRLPWWLTRLARGGDVLAPGPAGLPLQYIDVRDLSAWLLDAAARGLGGPYNAVSPPGHTTMGELLGECLRVTGGAATLRWVRPEPILAAGVVPWNDLPIWIPPGHEYRPLHEADSGKAAAAGLTCRPVADTVADTWAWLDGTGATIAGLPGRAAVGLDPAVETALLAALRDG